MKWGLKPWTPVRISAAALSQRCACGAHASVPLKVQLRKGTKGDCAPISGWLETVDSLLEVV